MEERSLLLLLSHFLRHGFLKVRDCLALVTLLWSPSPTPSISEPCCIFKPSQGPGFCLLGISMCAFPRHLCMVRVLVGSPGLLSNSPDITGPWERQREVWGHLGALFCWDGRRVSNDWTSLGHGVALWFCACVCLSGCPDLAVPPLWLFLDSG